MKNDEEAESDPVLQIHAQHQTPDWWLQKCVRVKTDDDDKTFEEARSSHHIGSRQRILQKQRSEMQPKALVLHKVLCEGGSENHETHHSGFLYLDEPCLVAGDSRESMIKGEHQLSNIDGYLEDHPDISFIIHRTYICEKYHHQVSDNFQRSSSFKPNTKIPSQTRTNLFTLAEDGPKAQPDSENMSIVSEELKSAFRTMQIRSPDRFGGATDPPNMFAPYLYFYHNLAFMKECVAGDLPRLQKLNVEAVLNYLGQSYGTEYEEADYLFSQGKVSLKHFSKIFGPNELVVTQQDYGTIALMSSKCPKPSGRNLALSCWSWRFNGVFQVEQTQIDILWPHCPTEVIRISTLTTYPLRLAKPGLEEKLRRRGSGFWSLRHRQYVTYDAPKRLVFELQTVSRV